MPVCMRVHVRVTCLKECIATFCTVILFENSLNLDLLHYNVSHTLFLQVNILFNKRHSFATQCSGPPSKTTHVFWLIADHHLRQFGNSHQYCKDKLTILGRVLTIWRGVEDHRRSFYHVSKMWTVT